MDGLGQPVLPCLDPASSHTYTHPQPVVARLGQKRANGIGLLLTGFGVLGLPIADAYIRAHSVQLWLVIVPSVLTMSSGYMLINSLIASFISTHARPEMQVGGVEGTLARRRGASKTG